MCCTGNVSVRNGSDWMDDFSLLKYRYGYFEEEARQESQADLGDSPVDN